jgi:hypothetical protein
MKKLFRFPVFLNFVRVKNWKFITIIPCNTHNINTTTRTHNNEILEENSCVELNKLWQSLVNDCNKKNFFLLFSAIAARTTKQQKTFILSYFLTRNKMSKLIFYPEIMHN